MNHRPFDFVSLEHEAAIRLLGSGVHQCEGGKSAPCPCISYGLCWGVWGTDFEFALEYACTANKLFVTGSGLLATAT